MTPEQLLAQVEFFGSAKASRAVAHAAGDHQTAAQFGIDATTALHKVQAEIERLYGDMKTMRHGYEINQVGLLVELAAARPVLEAAKVCAEAMRVASAWLIPEAQALVAAVDASEAPKGVSAGPDLSGTAALDSPTESGTAPSNVELGLAAGSYAATGDSTSTGDVTYMPTSRPTEADWAIASTLRDAFRPRELAIPSAHMPMPAGCCDLHGPKCEAPSDLCCLRCTEAGHNSFPIPHADGTPCVLKRAEEGK